MCLRRKMMGFARGFLKATFAHRRGWWWPAGNGSSTFLMEAKSLGGATKFLMRCSMDTLPCPGFNVCSAARRRVGVSGLAWMAWYALAFSIEGPEPRIWANPPWKALLFWL